MIHMNNLGEDFLQTAVQLLVVCVRACVRVCVRACVCVCVCVLMFLLFYIGNSEITMKIKISSRFYI